MFIFLVLLFTFAFGATAAEDPAQPEERSDAADLVVVRVSGNPITEKQVLDVVNQLARQENLTLEQSQQRYSMFFDRAVENLITLTLMRAQARETNIVVDAAEVDAQIQQMSQRFPNPEAFQKALTDQGATETALRESIMENIRMQKIADAASKDVARITDAELEIFYNDNSDKFTQPERARVAHILMQIPADATVLQKAEIRKKLEGIRIDIEADLITFADAASKYSEDAKTAAKGGEMGFVTRDNVPKSFSDIIFRVKPGTVSPALESQSGYHVLTVLELKPAGIAAFEEAKSAIRQFMEQNAMQTARQKFVEELKSKAAIEYFMTAEEFENRRK